MTPIELVLSKVEDAQKTSNGWDVLCPAHEDRKQSLSISEGDEGKVLLKCHKGCATKTILDAMGLAWRDVFPPDNGASLGAEVEAYTYTDAQGQPLCEVVRFQPKNFRQRLPDGRWGLRGIEPVVYRLKSVLGAAKSGHLVFIVEGEKDVHTLEQHGFVATTNAMGAGKWKRSYSESLSGARVVVIPDNDETGRTHAQQVARMTCGVAKTVKVVELPDLPDKGDVTDWLENHTMDQLMALVKTTPEWTPPADEPPWRAGDTNAPDREFLRKTDLSSPSSPSPSLSPSSSPLSPSPPIWEPFPIDAFPGRIAPYVSKVAAAIGCDLSMVALGVLACLAGAIGNRRRVRLKDSWSEPAIVWAVVVARSGSLKSPALDEVTRHLRQREASEIEAECERKAQYKQELQAWEDFLPKNKRGERPAAPEPAIRSVISDVTVEALALRLSGSPLGLLLYRDELAAWLQSFDAYKKGRGGDAQQWLEMHRAGTIFVDRKTGDTISVRRAAVSIIGGVQPQVLLTSLGIEHLTNGLAARLLFVMPPERAKKWTAADISEDARREWAGLLDELMALSYRGEPLDLLLAPDARNAFIEFYEDHAQREADAENDPFAAALAKLAAYAARFALVLELADNPGAVCVRLPAMESGIRLARWFASEAERVYARFHETDVDREQRRLVEWITDHGGETTERELSRGPRRYRPPGEAEKALTNLVKAGLGTWRPIHNGGRPTRRFVLTARGDGSESQRNPGKRDVSSPWEGT